MLKNLPNYLTNDLCHCFVFISTILNNFSGFIASKVCMLFWKFCSFARLIIQATAKGVNLIIQATAGCKFSAFTPKKEFPSQLLKMSLFLTKTPCTKEYEFYLV
jgi:hypothetical protein